MKKRILAMLLTVTMLVGMVPVPAFATETEPVEAIEEIIETTAAVTEAAEETVLPEDTEAETEEPEEEYFDEVSDEAAYAAPSGEVIGSVRVIVENTTCTADEGASWTGTLVDTEVALLDDMTMMTAILTALNDNGHTWEGTGGDDSNGWDITYISSISKDGTEALAEFHGGQDSGWMGTLNDWFVNLGFEQWKAGSDLLDGDVIRLMYTQSRGADIGGGFGSNEGYLGSLSASAGTLAPAFDKETLDYTLTVESDVTAVDITASAENKEDKVTVTAGGTEYRRGEGVAVADGTEITVACGEKTYIVTVSVAAEEECQHQWTDATCKAPKTCSLCGETEGEVGDHSWVNATCQAPKTCSVCSATEGEVGDHSYVDGICSVCGEAEEVLTPFSEKISLPSNGDSSWGYVSGLTLSGTDGGIYEAYWSSSVNPFVVDVILTQDTALDATITAAFSTAGLRKPSISGETTVTLQDGKGAINVTAVSGVSAFYPNTSWTINLIVDDGSAALRPTYEVTLPTDTVGYTVAAYNSSAPVIEGRKFSFTVTIPFEYTTEETFTVKANDVVLTAENGIYTIENITEAQVVTVEGVRAKTLAELNVTVIAPEGSTVSSGRHYSYFKYDFSEPLEETILEDGRIQKVFPTQNGRSGFIRVQHPEGVTYWDFDGLTAGKVFEITEEMLFIGSEEFTPKTVYSDFEKNIKDKADLYLTVNEKGWLDMATGDTWNLNVFRNFLSLGNTITNDCLALPDTHYQVIDVNGNPSDVVSVTPDANNSCYAEIRAENPGTAIILVTYDAVLNNKGEGGKQWSALWPENTGVIVVTVDGAAADFATNMTVNEEANGTGKQVIDAEHDILFYVGSKGASYSFKPDAGCSVTVNRSTVGSEMTFGGFTSGGVRTASDGTVTVSGLTTGTHIIKVEKDGAAVYQVIRARQVSFELLHSDGTEVTAGSPAQPGETITVQFHELVSPMEKLSGVYNTNFAFRYTGENGEIVQSTSSSGYGVYTFSGNESLQKFTVTIPSYWNENTFALTDGAIRLGGYGSNAGAHRTLTYIAGKEVNTNASGVSGYLSVLPEIVINTIPCGYESYKVTLPTGEGYTVTGGTVPVTEGDSYSFTVSITGGYDGENMVVLVNGEAIEAVDGTYTVENVREDLTVTVEGVAKIPEAEMSHATVIYTNGVDGSGWGRANYGWVDTVTFGGAEVVSYTWDGDTCNVLLSYDTAKNAVVGFAVSYAGRNDTYISRMSATLNGVAMTAGVPSSAKLIDGSATVKLYAQCMSDRYNGTKTFVLHVQETPADVVEAVTTVEGLIDSIELPVDLEDETAILEAWEAYEALPEKVKQQITNADILMNAKAELEALKAVKLASGKSVALQSALSGKVTWSLDKEYAPYASITAAGKLTAKRVLEKVSVFAVATDAEGNAETLRIDIYPAVSQVKILDENGTLVNNKTVPVKVNDGSDETYVFTAGNYPSDAMGDVIWTVSDKKGAMVNYEISGNEITIQPAENVKKGTVTLTATSADGSNKKASVKLNIAVLVEDFDVTAKEIGKTTLDDEGNTIFTVASGMSVTLTAVPTNANATNKAIAWSIVEGGEYASVSSSGKLTAVKDLMGVKYAVVRASAKDGGGAYTDTKIKITPLALGVQMYCGGRVCTGITRMQNMTAQDTLTLNARVYPLGKANQSVTWTSSNKKIASVTVDENGIANVTCLKAGKVTITATAADGSKEKATFTLNIVQGIESLTLEDQVIAVKKSLNLAKLIQINPTTATNKKLTWTIVGDTFGAKISSSGVLDTKKVDVSGGPVVLTVSASAQDGCGATPATCTVTVYPATTKKMVVMNGEEVVGKKDVLELEVGKTLTLKGFCEGAANVYTWGSNNKNVQVENGVITASEAAIGKTVTITCTAADGTNVKVSVKVKIIAPATEE